MNRRLMAEPRPSWTTARGSDPIGLGGSTRWSTVVPGNRSLAVTPQVAGVGVSSPARACRGCVVNARGCVVNARGCVVHVRGRVASVRGTRAGDHERDLGRWWRRWSISPRAPISGRASRSSRPSGRRLEAVPVMIGDEPSHRPAGLMGQNDRPPLAGGLREEGRLDLHAGEWEVVEGGHPLGIG